MFLSIVTLLIRPSLGATTSLLTKLTALKFGNDRSSYIKFTPDWSPFSNRVSACAWIRDLGSAIYRPVFQASGYELVMTANGPYISILGQVQHLQSKISVAKGTWFHECVTWSTSSGTHRVYINGKEIGAKSTPDRLMKATGALTLGNYGGNNNAWMFGGEMVYLNFYAKELSASEVASMSQRGMCSHIADVDEHESSRVIKWEDLVKIGRSGTVTDIDITDCRYLKEILEESDQRFNETVQLENELEDVSTRLNSTLAELEETQAEKVENKQKLEDVWTRLNSTLAELEEISANLKLSKTWDWDIFLSEQFLNQTFTSENSQLLRSAWDDIAGIESRHFIFTATFII